jgi:hypothetical protein
MKSLRWQAEGNFPTNTTEDEGQHAAASTAAQNGVRTGDVLVGLHVWETISYDNVNYVLDHPQLGTFNPLKFYILRGDETLYGHVQVPMATAQTPVETRTR